MKQCQLLLANHPIHVKKDLQTISLIEIQEALFTDEANNICVVN